MAGSKFQYDESGGTFFYFLLSFLALVLIPASYYLWPKKDEKDDKDNASKNCQCEVCIVKRGRLASKEPGKTTKQWITKCCIVLGWIVFLAVAYKVAHLERDYVDWDPFEILQIDRAASQAEIKRAYRKLSLVYHPDKDTGDAKKFLQLTKAHAALTDEEAKKNWEMYGNPDGPGAMSFGIALPSWIVEKENSIWVLGLYALVFMVALPVAVGIWWYRSIKFGGDQILLGTTKLYYYFINKSHSMNLKRVLMVLAGSFEFQKGQNNEIVERPSDNVEVPVIMKEFTGFGEKNKEPPLCYSYSLKARALLYAHLSRLSLPPLTLDIDRLYVVKKCPYLIQEFVQCISQMTMMAYSGHVSQMPTLETLEICMKLSPLIIQALWDKSSPILQLPHIKEDMLRHFVTKTRNIRSVRSLMELSGKERRALLRTLSDSEYEDVMRVASQMPYVDISVDTEVLDDEKPTTITVGSIVTVTIELSRQNMGEAFRYNEEEDDVLSATKEDEEASLPEGEASTSANTKKPPVWKKKKGKTTKPKKKGAAKQHNFTKRNAPTEVKTAVEEVGKDKSKSKQTKDDAGDSTSNSDSENDEISDSEKETKEKEKEKEKKDNRESKAQAEEDDQEWNKIQAKLGNKDKAMESRSLLSHDVHCPYFPDEKQEYWWLYIIDRKNKILMTMPNHITDLVDTRQMSLKFTAPEKVGSYAYQVCLRSDSYLDADAVESFKIDVQMGEERVEEVKYGVTDDEAEDKDESSANEVTDDDLDDEDSDDD